MTVELPPVFVKPMSYPSDLAEYLVDAGQRWVLYTDVLRKRGNLYLKHLKDGQPPVLNFDYEIILDGRTLDRPVNYAVARILPDDGVAIDPKKRPVVVIDPRAGHGPGIGGSKKDSEIGIAMKQGHPVYFVLFYPEPERGQTLADVKNAQVRFIEEVRKLHPDAEDEPAVIGNCQAGWAVALIGADRPDVTGPLVLNGSPLSFWSGEKGKNRMRIRGGLMGGAWMASLFSDLGAGTFDGAHLVSNFESLNPANTLWSKQYNLYANVDTEEKRYLNFEKWWNGYFDMTSEEIKFIVQQLFVGNNLERGEVTLEDKINLKNIDDPMLVFSSSGDNITPPLQALSWIPQVYETTDEIRRNNKVIIFMIHEKVGHLGIFVSGSVAKKEHNQIIQRLDLMEWMPPGLYQMVIEEGDKEAGITDYKVKYIPKEVEDIVAMNDGLEDEEQFPAVAAVSQLNDRYYDAFVGPWVKLFSNEISAQIARQLHPLRLSRYAFSDMNWGMLPFQATAPLVKEQRRKVSEDNVFRRLEQCNSDIMVGNLNLYRKFRDNTMEFMFHSIYGSPFGAMITEYVTPRGATALPVSQLIEDKEELERVDRERWLAAIEEGGFVEAVARIMVSLVSADKILDPSEFDVFKERAKSHELLTAVNGEHLKKVIREQSRIVQTDEELALQALPKMLVSPEEREEALKMAEEIVWADHELHAEEESRLEHIRELLQA